VTPAEKLSEKEASKARDKIKAKLRRKTPYICHLKRERKRLGLTLEKVSKVVGVAVGSLWQIEAGCTVTLANAFKLAKFFGKTVDELWQLKA